MTIFNKYILMTFGSNKKRSSTYFLSLLKQHCEKHIIVQSIYF